MCGKERESACDNEISSVTGARRRGVFCLEVSDEEESSSNFLLTFKDVQTIQDSWFQSLF